MIFLEELWHPFGKLDQGLLESELTPGMVELHEDNSDTVTNLLKDIATIIDIHQVIAVIEFSDWSFIRTISSHYPLADKFAAFHWLWCFATIRHQAPVSFLREWKLVIENKFVWIDTAGIQWKITLEQLLI